MSLAVVLDTLTTRIGDALEDGVQVSDAAPAAADDLPAVTLTIEDARERLAGVGRIPRGTRSGALPVSIEINLADPVLDLGGESLNLLSPDRRTLTVPHGPLVRADGVGDPPFGPDDLGADDGQPYTVVSGTPTDRQVRPDPVQGILEFGQPLPATGQLALTYHIGQWDVTVVRYQGDLGVRATDTSASGVHDLSVRVADVLGARDIGVRLAPRSWGAVLAEQVGDAAARAQLLTYRFDAELEQPLLPSGGGVIARITVILRDDNGDDVETFHVVREGVPT